MSSVVPWTPCFPTDNSNILVVVVVVGRAFKVSNTIIICDFTNKQSASYLFCPRAQVVELLNYA